MTAVRPALPVVPPRRPAAPIRVCEIYGPVIQGEGAMIGVPTVFVRTGGCDFRCSWCDSMYAVDPIYKETWLPKTAQQIMDEVARLSGGVPCAITLSGGNPALYDWTSFLGLAHERGYPVAIETQGSKPKTWMADLDYLTLSPKPPSSGMTTDWDKLARCIALGRSGAHAAGTSLKIVVFDERDYAYAQEVYRRHPDVTFYLQVGNEAPGQGEEPSPSDLLRKLGWLWEKVLADRWHAARPLPQLHTLIHGNQRAT